MDRTITGAAQDTRRRGARAYHDNHLKPLDLLFGWTDSETFPKAGSKNMSIWWLIGIFVFWFLLQAYILPKFGIST